jgi:selenocysteine lyase/cysteine desulfurase
MFNPEIWRDEFPHTNENSVYLNHAAISPLPKGTTDLVKRSLKMRQSGSVEDFQKDDLMMEKTRILASKLINAPSIHQIAFIPNTSHGLNIIANGIPLKENDEILLHPFEFPTNVYPWMNQVKRKVKLKFLPENDGRLPLHIVEQHITPRTRIFALSAVQFISGFKADLKAITTLCHKHGIFVVVDGIQAAGCVPIDVKDSGIDAFCAGGHKWMMCPQGVGFLYLSERLLTTLTQTELGWLSVKEPWDFFNFSQEIKRSASRFECGMANVPGLYGMCGSLDLLLKVNPNNAFEHIKKLGNIIAKELTEVGFELYTDITDVHRSGITTFTLPKYFDETELLNTLSSEKIYISVRNHKLRFSPHFYNTEADVYMATDTVKNVFTVL